MSTDTLLHRDLGTSTHGIILPEHKAEPSPEAPDDATTGAEKTRLTMRPDAAAHEIFIL
jgi:hypothetical protein